MVPSNRKWRGEGVRPHAIDASPVDPAQAWHFDQRVRCTAGHIVGVLTRLANDRAGPDPLADGKSRSIRSRISGGTKWLGLRSKSKSPKFGADRKHYYPDDDTA